MNPPTGNIDTRGVDRHHAPTHPRTLYTVTVYAVEIVTSFPIRGEGCVTNAHPSRQAQGGAWIVYDAMNGILPQATESP